MKIKLGKGIMFFLKLRLSIYKIKNVLKGHSESSLEVVLNLNLTAVEVKHKDWKICFRNNDVIKSLLWVSFKLVSEQIVLYAKVYFWRLTSYKAWKNSWSSPASDLIYIWGPTLESRHTEKSHPDTSLVIKFFAFKVGVRRHIIVIFSHNFLYCYFLVQMSCHHSIIK